MEFKRISGSGYGTVIKKFQHNGRLANAEETLNEREFIIRTAGAT
jgi:hypothetical protein